jgi:hypothetical protein
LIVNLQKAQIDLIEFAKKQQWTITNYSVLIYAAIFGVAHAFNAATKAARQSRKRS